MTRLPSEGLRRDPGVSFELSGINWSDKLGMPEDWKVAELGANMVRLAKNSPKNAAIHAKKREKLHYPRFSFGDPI